ncbi:hypothetical protein BGX34_000085 [Mortierella sp. NVP85]|nr:hypothetical protein BGX34_000085 [Mortierella sp. NVP85]
MAFYESGKLEDVYTVTSILRAVSGVAVGFMAICYLILPSRRRHPHSIVLTFSVLAVPWEAIGTAWLYMKKELLCRNEYEIATMSNSWFCGFQGISLMYLVLVLLCLAVLMITNLHFVTVYRSNFIQKHLSKFIPLMFLLPLSLVLPVALRKQIENPGFGSICFVSAKVASPYFFYPLSVTVCLASLIHLGTIAFMIRSIIRANSASVSDSMTSDSEHSNSNSNNSSRNTTTSSKKQRGLRTARDVSLFLKQQWRPGLFALWILIIEMIYWLFYFLEAKKLEHVDLNKPWFRDWMACLYSQLNLSGLLQHSMAPTPDELQAAGDAAQSACASIASGHVPSFIWAAFADMLPATVGIMILVIFGSKLELWQDLRTLFLGAPQTTTEFGMTNPPKENRDRHNRYYSQQQEQQPQQQQYEPQEKGSIQDRNIRQNEQDRHVDEARRDRFYNSDDIVIPPQVLARAISNGKSVQSELRAGATVAPGAGELNGVGVGTSDPSSAIPSSPTLPGSFKSSNSRGTYGGPTRKLSVRFLEEEREPILYRQPSTTTEPVYNHSGPLDIEAIQSHQDAIHEKINRHHARIAQEGTDPWPSWPSTLPPLSPTIDAPLILETRRPSLTVRTNSLGGRHRRNPSIGSGSTRATPVSPSISPVVEPSRGLSSPVSANFYNSQDLAAGETMQAVPRGSSSNSNNNTNTNSNGGSTNSSNGRQSPITAPRRVGSLRHLDRNHGSGLGQEHDQAMHDNASLPSSTRALSPPIPQKSYRRG